MAIKPFDIHNATFRWKGCIDMRPWLIVEIRPNQTVACFPIASESYGASSFYLDISDPDFPATGLKKSCYIHDSHLFDVPVADFGKFRGALAGDLLKAFREYAGF